MLILFIIKLIAILLLQYFLLAPLNISDFGFWLIASLILSFIISMISYYRRKDDLDSDVFSWLLMPIGAILILLVIYPTVAFFSGPVFHSNKYANILEVKEAPYSEFPETNIENIPLIDRDSAQMLGSRFLGGLSDHASQFKDAEDYTQVTIKGKPYRVTPLEYAGIFQWFSNKEEGIPGYLKLDMTNGKIELVELEKPIKYSKSEMFSRDLMRHLFFKYPTKIFRDPSFEIDDEGNPFYIATTYKKISVNDGLEPESVIIVDATDGKTTEYSLDEVPEWVDRVYASDLVMERIDNNGSLKKGFMNYVFSKTGVTYTTEGYNYVTIGDDLYLYTGITSAAAENSNLGFVLVNMRTRDAVKYKLPSATETSAMGSAEGSVQEKGYKATFPILINIKGKPWYIMSLKDEAGLVKSYALVNAQDYQEVFVSTKVIDVLENITAVGDLEVGISEGEVEGTDNIEVSGQIKDVKSYVVDGNTVFFFTIDGEIYKAPIIINDDLAYIKNEDKVSGKITDDNVFKTIDVIKVNE